MKKNNNDQPKQFSRRNFLSVTSAGLVGLSGMRLTAAQAASTKKDPREPVNVEWRNKVEGMAYRQLGRTGMMISEVVNGGDPVRLKSFKQVEIAIDRGVNYLDMAPQYGKGECEEAYSKVIDSSSKRMKVFMTTKASGYQSVRDSMYHDIYKGLPSGKQEAIIKKAKEMREDRMVDKPGYFIKYWPGQGRSMDKGFVSNAMAADYAHKVDGDPRFQSFIKESLEGSLKRAKTDHFDIMMIPHGANSPEEVQIPEIFSTFDELKKEGKVRFMGVSTHNDPAGVVEAAAATGKYDMAMCAYNIINGGYMDGAIRKAAKSGMGIIAMKAAMAVASHHKAINPIPEWRIGKVDRIVPGTDKAPVKAYLWALQNPNISAVISNLWDEKFIEENLAVVGRKVQLNPG